jgi:dipeptidyl aminopeptidase/acylaminoacyl peptidase
MARLASNLGAGLLVALFCTEALTARAGTTAISIEDQIEMRRPRDAQISPDGRWVSFVLTTPRIATNDYLHDLYVVSIDGASAPYQLTRRPPRTRLLSSFQGPRPVWMPDSDRLLYVAGAGDEAELRQVRVTTGKERTLLRQNELGGARFANLEGADYTEVGKAWVEPSPDGRYVAFLATERLATPARGNVFHALEVPDPDWRIVTPAGNVDRLWVLDIRSRSARPVTPPTVTVSWFDWAPDGRGFVLEASSRLGPTAWMANDIYRIDAAGRNLELIVKLDGWDRQPKWSPDGEYIAFGSQQGQEDWRYGSVLAVVKKDGSSLRYVGTEIDRVAGGRLREPHWSPDGRWVEFVNSFHLGLHLFRVDVAKETLARVTPREDRLYSTFSWSKDGSRLAFIMEGVGLPPEVYVSASDRFTPRALTALNPQWSSRTLPTVDTIEWRSRDDRWTVHGLLIKSSTYRTDRLYPLLVVNVGGPTMVRQGTNPVPNYALLTIAEMGYVVLIPNSRGRQGYGREFLQAIRDERSYASGPAQDVRAGVEALTERRIADPDAIGIVGFSYGEILTMLSIIADQRFKAAIVGGGASDLIFRLVDTPDEWWPLKRDMFGLSNIVERTNIDRAIEQTAIFYLDRVKTPVLIESGEYDGYEEHQRLFRGLRHFGVPVEHHVYPRSGHGYEEPQLIQDSYRRQIAWLDYWIRGAPYPNQDRQRGYDKWKEVHVRPERPH